MDAVQSVVLPPMVFCYSPMRTAVAPMNAHFLKNRDHQDFGADVKLHGIGEPLAIPNPYSSSKSCFKPM